MDKKVEEVRIQKSIFRENLKKWYEARKTDYDKDRFLESHTAEERGKITALRRRAADEEKKERARRKELAQEREEESKIEAFVKSWEILTEER